MDQRSAGGLVLPGWASTARYLALTTFRASGAPVTTPVWFAVHDDRILVWTGASTGKVRRLAANPAVTIAACSMRGQLRAAPVAGVARLLPSRDAQYVHERLTAKYGLVKRLYDYYLHARSAMKHQPQEPGSFIEIRMSQTP